MSKVPSFIRQKNKVTDEQIKYLNKIKTNRMNILDKAIAEKKNIIYLSKEEINFIQNMEIYCIQDLMYINNLFKEYINTYGKILAKVLTTLYKNNIMTKNEIYDLYEYNFANTIDVLAKTKQLPIKVSLILLNIIFTIKDSESKNFFGVKTNFILGTGKKNVILYGRKYANCNTETVNVIQKMKINDNIHLIKIINETFEKNNKKL